MRNFPAAGQMIVNVALAELVTFVNVEEGAEHALYLTSEGTYATSAVEDLETLETFIRKAREGAYGYGKKAYDAANGLVEDCNPVKGARRIVMAAHREGWSA